MVTTSERKLDTLRGLWIKAEVEDEEEVEHHVTREEDELTEAMPIQLEKEDLQEMMAQAMRTALEATSRPATPSAGGKVVNEDGEINTISVKLPSFWTENPEVWFLCAESQFNTKALSKTK